MAWTLRTVYFGGISVSKLKKTAFIWDDKLADHQLGLSHPLKPVRLRYTHQLLQAYGAFKVPQVKIIKPRLVTQEELRWYHTLEYIEMVERLDQTLQHILDVLLLYVIGMRG